LKKLKCKEENKERIQIRQSERALNFLNLIIFF
jgi:hypothetical protein